VAVPLQQLTGQRVRLGHTDADGVWPAVTARTVSC
jgi:hypothetical protein